MFKVMFYGGFVLAVICLILSIVFFIRNDVAKLIGDVTGWNARKAIRKLNKKGAEDISKTEAIKTEVSKVLVHSASTTGALHIMSDASDKPAEPKKRRKSRRGMPGDEKTDVLSEKPIVDRPVREIFQPEEDMIVLAGCETTKEGNSAGSVYSALVDNEETGVLSGDEETDLLADNEKTSVLPGDEETDLLADGEKTSVLSSGLEDAMKKIIAVPEEKPLPAIFDVEEEATVVHTEESIGALDE